MEVKIDILYNNLHSEFFNLIETNYDNSLALKSFIRDSKKGFDKVIDSKEIVTFYCEKENELIAHISLIVNSQKEAYFGFFECVKTEIFPFLWNKLVEKAKKMGLESVFGPVNGSIWHPYRLLSFSNGEDFFPGEPINNLYYHKIFEELSPVNIIRYHSAYRTDYSPILAATKKSWDKLNDNDIQIIKADINKELFIKLFEFSKSTFSNNPGYSNITLKDFLELYSSDKIDENKTVVYLALKNKEILGFCFNMIVKNSLIMKTIAVDEKWQQMGIANAMVNKTHNYALDKKIEKVIYALVRKDNNVKNFTMDKLIKLREYSAYKFEV